MLMTAEMQQNATIVPPCRAAPEQQRHHLVLFRYLIETDFEHLAEAMYKAPFVCLCHNNFEEGVTDPVFIYANRAGLQLFEATWDELIGLPSRLSADSAEEEQVLWTCGCHTSIHCDTLAAVV